MPEDKIEYLVIKSSDHNEFEQWVNIAIKDGWEPYGNLVVLPENDDFFITFIQAMIRRAFYRHSIVEEMKEKSDVLQG